MIRALLATRVPLDLMVRLVTLVPRVIRALLVILDPLELRVQLVILVTLGQSVLSVQPVQHLLRVILDPQEILVTQDIQVTQEVPELLEL